MALVVHLPIPTGPFPTGPFPTGPVAAPVRRSSARPTRSSGSTAPRGRHLEAVPPARTGRVLDRAVYRRRRLAFGAGAAVLLLCTSLALGAFARWLVTDPVAQAGTPSGTPVAARTVQPGETLWSLAAELRPQDDRRAAVDRLARLNGGPELRAGATLYVPSSWLHGAP